MDGVITRRIRVYGIVQGVGFRPTVSRHAMETGITGTVANCGPYVEIYAQGTQTQVDAFRDALEHRPPKRAAILKLDDKAAEDAPRFSEFSIMIVFLPSVNAVSAAFRCSFVLAWAIPRTLPQTAL